MLPETGLFKSGADLLLYDFYPSEEYILELIFLFTTI